MKTVFAGDSAQSTLAKITVFVFAAFGAAGGFAVYESTTEAKAAKFATQKIVDAIVLAGNAGNFADARKDVADFIRSVGPEAQTPGGLYFAGKPLFGARATLSVGDIEDYGARVGGMKDASKELFDTFGRIMITLENTAPPAPDPDVVVEVLAAPETATKTLIERARDLGAGERKRIQHVMRDGGLGDKRAEALALVAETTSRDDLDDAIMRIADAMRSFPRTRSGAIDKAAGLANRLGRMPSHMKKAEQNLRILRGGLGTTPVEASGAERDLMIRTVYGEAAEEGEIGLAAVASVIRNRLQSERFGSSLRDVITSPAQFNASPTDRSDGGKARRLDDDSPEFEKIAEIVDEVLDGTRPDPTGGALYFYNPELASPAWAARLSDRTRIGDHVYGTVGALLRARPLPLPGQTQEQFERITAAIRDQESLRRDLRDNMAGDNS